MDRKAIICRTPDVMGGAAVFAGTRVPVQTLLDYLEGGESIEDFLQGFPSVSRQQVIEFLEQAAHHLEPRFREGFRRRMRRLASGAGDRRPRSEDGTPDGWTTIKNGELLAVAAKEFDVFLTVDRNLSFQQHLPAFSIAVVVLCAKSNRLADLQALVPELLAALPNAKSGTLTQLGNI